MKGQDTTSQDDNKGSAELARWREKRVWEKMAASKTWDAMKSVWLSSSLSGKNGADDLEFSPDESLRFSKEKLPENKTKDDNKVILKGIISCCAAQSHPVYYVFETEHLSFYLHTRE